MANATLRVQVYLDHEKVSDESVTLIRDRINYFGRAKECGKQGLQFDLGRVPTPWHGYISRHQAMIGYNPTANEWLLIDGAFVREVSDQVIRYIWRGKQYYLRPSKNGLYYRGARVKRHMPLRDGTQFNFALVPGFAVLGIFSFHQDSSIPGDIEHPTVSDGVVTQASMSPLSHIPEGVKFEVSPEFDSLSQSSSRWVRTVANVNNLVDDTAKSAKNWAVFLVLLLSGIAIVAIVGVIANHVEPQGLVEWLQMLGDEG